MSEQQQQEQSSQAVQQRAPRYPNAFLFGASCGITLNAFTRQYTMEPLSARPLNYIKTALAFGSILFYYDYWRRTALEHVLQREDELRYFKTMQALNHNLRIGDEDDLSNLTEYLAGSTTRA